MWHQWFNRNFMKLQEYFLHTNLFNNLLSSMSVFDMHSREYHNACMWYCWHRSRHFDVETECAAPRLQAEECTCMHYGTLVNPRQRLSRKIKCWIKSLFLLSLCTKSILVVLSLNYWCHMGYFNNVVTTFLYLEFGSCVAVYAGSESSRISSKIS